MTRKQTLDEKVTEDVILELPVGGDRVYPDLVDAIMRRHPGVEMLYRPGLRAPELYLGSCDRVFRGLELLRHMYLKP
jgi:hypothetical protein